MREGLLTVLLSIKRPESLFLSQSARSDYAARTNIGGPPSVSPVTMRALLPLAPAKFPLLLQVPRARYEKISD
jgi:hypothetical protein